MSEYQDGLEQNIISWRPHPHTPRNPNTIQEEEQKSAGFNQWLAVLLTRGVGSMWTAYVFTVVAIIGLFGLLGWLSPFTFLLTTWASQQFAQLVLLPIIMVGDNVLSRHQEIQADETFKTTQKSFYDIEQIMQHLSAQDTELLKQTQLLIDLAKNLGGNNSSEPATKEETIRADSPALNEKNPGQLQQP